jgi:hypothetical protein
VKQLDRTVLATGGQFVPRVLAVRGGERVTFHNRLPVPTNVRGDLGNLDAFNVMLATDMLWITNPLSASHNPGVLQSSIYRWMTGYLWVFDHPYFAVTDADGRFEIANVPPGTWRLAVWHETVGYLGGGPGRLGTKITVPEPRAGELKLAPLVFESKSW